MTEVSTAIEKLIAAASPTAATETVAVINGLGRVLATECPGLMYRRQITARWTATPSAFGWREQSFSTAFTSEYCGNRPQPLPHPPQRIFTGGEIPPGDSGHAGKCTENDGQITINNPSAGVNIRPGTDIQRGDYPCGGHRIARTGDGAVIFDWYKNGRGI